VIIVDAFIISGVLLASSASAKASITTRCDTKPITWLWTQARPANIKRRLTPALYVIYLTTLAYKHKGWTLHIMFASQLQGNQQGQLLRAHQPHLVKLCKTFARTHTEQPIERMHD
jgi:hypothetical protein